MDCLLRVGVIGINFKTADLGLREEIARATVGLTGEARQFFPYATVTLSTCNRCEIYFGDQDLAEAHTHLLQFLRREVPFEFEHRLYSYFGIDCLAHLCRVTAGLDSAIVAETEIQGQVKKSYSGIRDLPAGMHFLFQKALRVGKEIRASLPTIRGGASLFVAIWDQIGRSGFEIAKAKILFVGHSQMSRELMHFLGKRGMQRAHLCTRYPKGAPSEFLAADGVRGREILSDWDRYDLIFCASKSSSPLLLSKSIDRKRRLLFDLSVPRNVQPSVSALPGVELYNIEQLDQRAQESGFARQKILYQCEERVRIHAQRLCSIYRKKVHYPKTPHVLECAGRGSHRECFPCQ